MKFFITTIFSLVSTVATASVVPDILACQLEINNKGYYDFGVHFMVNSKADGSDSLVNNYYWNYKDKYTYGICAKVVRSENDMKANVEVTRYSFKSTFNEFQNLEFDSKCNAKGEFQDKLIHTTVHNMNAGESWLGAYMYQGEFTADKLGFYLAKPSEYEKINVAQSGSLCYYLVTD